MRDRLERAALHSGGVPAAVLRARPVPGGLLRGVGVPMRGRVGGGGLRQEDGGALRGREGRRRRYAHPDIRERERDDRMEGATL